MLYLIGVWFYIFQHNCWLTISRVKFICFLVDKLWQHISNQRTLRIGIINNM